MESQVYRLIKGRFGEKAAEPYKNTDINSVDSFITDLRTKGSNYVLTLVDWYVLSIKYPKVFTGENYGNYKLLFGGVDIKDAIPEKVYSSCPDVADIIDYISEFKYPKIFLFLDLFRSDSNYGILFGQASKKISMMIAGIKKSTGVFKDRKVVSNLRDVFGILYGFDVNLFDKNDELLSLDGVAEKLNLSKDGIQSCLNIINAKYIPSVLIAICGRVEGNKFVSISKLYKDAVEDNSSLELKEFRFRLNRLQRFHEVYDRFPTVKENKSLRDWMVDIYLKNSENTLSEDKKKIIYSTYPGLFEQLDKEVIWSRKYSSTDEFHMDVKECEIEQALRGKVSLSDISDLVESKGILTYDDYIEKIINGEKSHELLSILDWYILSLKYPDVFTSSNYGYYSLVFHSDDCSKALKNGLLGYLINNSKDFNKIDGKLIQLIREGSSVSEMKNMVFLDPRLGGIDLGGGLRACFDLRVLEDVKDIVERYIEKGVKEYSTKDVLNILGKYYGFGISVFSLADLSLNGIKLSVGSTKRITALTAKSLIGGKTKIYYENILEKGCYIEDTAKNGKFYFNDLRGLYLASDGKEDVITNLSEDDKAVVSPYIESVRDLSEDIAKTGIITEDAIDTLYKDDSLEKVRGKILNMYIPQMCMYNSDTTLSGDKYQETEFNGSSSLEKELFENVGFYNRSFYDKNGIASVEDYIKYLRKRPVGYILSPVDWYVLGIEYGTGLFSEENYGYYRVLFSSPVDRYDVYNSLGNYDSDGELKSKIDNYVSMSNNTLIVFRDVNTFIDDGEIGVDLSKLNLICKLALFDSNFIVDVRDNVFPKMFGMGYSLKDYQNLVSECGIMNLMALESYKNCCDVPMLYESMKNFYNKHRDLILGDIIGYKKDGVFYSLNSIKELMN